MKLDCEKPYLPILTHGTPETASPRPISQQKNLIWSRLVSADSMENPLIFGICLNGFQPFSSRFHALTWERGETEDQQKPPPIECQKAGDRDSGSGIFRKAD